jgi:hypothetical protein
LCFPERIFKWDFLPQEPGFSGKGCIDCHLWPLATKAAEAAAPMVNEDFAGSTHEMR